MNFLEKMLAGLILLTLVALVLKDGGRGANQVLEGLADFNNKTFGTFLR